MQVFHLDMISYHQAYIKNEVKLKPIHFKITLDYIKSKFKTGSLWYS